jgi:hypothetical protein
VKISGRPGWDHRDDKPGVEPALDRHLPRRSVEILRDRGAKDSRVPPSLSDTDAYNWPRLAAKGRRARLLSPSSTGCRVTFISSRA